MPETETAVTPATTPVLELNLCLVDKLCQAHKQMENARATRDETMREEENAAKLARIADKNHQSATQSLRAAQQTLIQWHSQVLSPPTPFSPSPSPPPETSANPESPESPDSPELQTSPPSQSQKSPSTTTRKPAIHASSSRLFQNPFPFLRYRRLVPLNNSYDSNICDHCCHNNNDNKVADSNTNKSSSDIKGKKVDKHSTILDRDNNTAASVDSTETYVKVSLCSRIFSNLCNCITKCKVIELH